MMGKVTLHIAGRDHSVACRPGEEAHLRGLAARLDTHAETALRASGGLSAERTLLYIALLLADELVEAERNPATGMPPAAMERIAERLEAVASVLEEDLPDA